MSCPHPGDLPNPGVKPESPEIPALHGFFTAEPWGKTLLCLTDCNIPNTRTQSLEHYLGFTNDFGMNAPAKYIDQI